MIRWLWKKRWRGHNCAAGCEVEGLGLFAFDRDTREEVAMKKIQCHAGSLLTSANSIRMGSESREGDRAERHHLLSLFSASSFLFLSSSFTCSFYCNLSPEDFAFVKVYFRPGNCFICTWNWKITSEQHFLWWRLLEEPGIGRLMWMSRCFEIFSWNWIKKSCNKVGKGGARPTPI